MANNPQTDHYVVVPKEPEPSVSDALHVMPYISSFEDAWAWYLWCPLILQVPIAIGILGLALITLRFIWATLPYSD